MKTGNFKIPMTHKSHDDQKNQTGVSPGNPEKWGITVDTLRIRREPLYNGHTPTLLLLQ
ncbi:18590_t:CDS:2 [Dentiscutata erythropus]|uniref:18590_t:CDS:1 n=1 Tax=Dentiscutata erythropus TaxID=1348616 RepID=A0A9N9D7X2_9GLOM|nr:18590_t:CDS:2 [Dentiscutata erythropus]